MVCLVLANPYDYVPVAEKAISAARAAESGLLVVFYISPTRLRRTVEELGEKGWLGPGSLRQLGDSMLEGYRALAEDVLKAVAERAEAVGVGTQVRTYEGSRLGLLGLLEAEGCSKVLADAYVGELSHPAAQEG